MRTGLTDDDIIAHYGTKGMRWGVRKKRKTSSDYKATAAYRKKHVSELTDHQLRTTTKRIKLEQDYQRVNPSLIKRGENSAKLVLGLAATAASLHKLSTTPAGKLAIDAGKNFVGNSLRRFAPRIPM